eukprot:2481952-Pleurochrysis_carterae.AAC.1
MCDHKIPVDNAPMRVDASACCQYSSSNIQHLLLKNLGPDFKLLIHVVEHYKMCNRSNGNGEAENGAAFSRGAMLALALAGGVTVAATYTHRPDLPASQFSAVWRDPVRYFRSTPTCSWPPTQSCTVRGIQHPELH